MFVKSDIRKVSIALEKGFYHEVYLALGEAGIIHLSPPGGRDAMMDAGLKEEESRTREILSGIETALHALDLEPGGVALPERAGDTAQDWAFVSKTQSAIERVGKLRSRIHEALDTAAQRVEYRGVLDRMGIDPVAFRGARLVRMVFGTVENIEWEPPLREKFEVSRAGGYACGVALPPDLPDLLQFLKGYGFTDRSEEITGASAEDLKRRMDTLRARLATLDRYMASLRDTAGRTLADMYGPYREYTEVFTAMKLSLFSAKALFVSGWMDERDRERLFDILRGICGDRFIAVVSDRRDPDAPVRMMNSRLLKPFELLVKTMGMPANSEIDPTPLTAITFVIMFGLMFGDLGQGLVIALGGLILKRISKKKGETESALDQAGGILIACGISAALCGILYGSIFSNEHLIPALLFHPIEEIMSLFSMTILLGALFISIGLGVNVINNLMNGNYTEALLEKRSLAVFVLYVAIILLAVRYVVTGQGPAPWVVGVFIVMPLVLFSLRGVLGPILFKSHKPHSAVEYIIETCVEILEIGLSMIANTVSFIRVGAFALSHAGLSIVTYTLAGIVDPSMRSVGAVTIIIVGNIFIIGFECLICLIQSMRLEYYEFFSKFFRGDGVNFAPFTLKAKTSEV
ncbi:MAG: V-type ATPase 116kDa subunit family protein [Syntrophales bacterium]|nr:V-type ATPase 116kDa subunit family protein [Syntrophales bacterium]